MTCGTLVLHLVPSLMAPALLAVMTAGPQVQCILFIMSDPLPGLLPLPDTSLAPLHHDTYTPRTTSNITSLPHCACRWSIASRPALSLARRSSR